MDPPAKPEAAAPQLVQEYVVRIPKDRHKHLNVMRFNHSLKVDVTKWKQVKMERENNYKEFKLDEELPKFGAGSEFGRDMKDEARRKKHGIITKQYNPEDQPWILKVGGKQGKKFKGIREGGVTENASYYVFSQAADGTFEAHPVEQWYNFTPIHCFKALSAEEAEEEFGRRDKVLNYFSIMVKKRLQKDTADDDDDEEKKAGNKKKKKKQRKEFKITDMDEWALDDSNDSGEEDEEEETDSKKPKKKVTKKKKKKDNKSDDEAVEESDEGDFDDKEVDYITSSSGSEEEVEEDEKANRELKGVEDEEALRKLSSDEEEEEPEEENKDNEDTTEQKDKNPEQKGKQKQKKTADAADSSGESSSESSDSDFDDPKFTSAIFVPKSKKKAGSDNSAGSSRANTPTKFQGDKEAAQKGQKRKYPEVSGLAAKKPKVESSPAGPSSSSSSSILDGINEDSVRRYLQRKPMTASELLHKFKSKMKTKMSPDQLVNKITDVLKRMPLQKTNIKGKLYLSLKTS